MQKYKKVTEELHILKPYHKDFKEKKIFYKHTEKNYL